MDKNWTPYIDRLREATESLGLRPKGQLIAALNLLLAGERHPTAHLDMLVSGNGPTFREAADSALAWAEAQEK